MNTPVEECQQRGYPIREVLEEAEFQCDELDCPLHCLRGPEPVSPPAWYSDGSWDILVLLWGGGQHFTLIAKGTAEEMHQGSSLINSVKLT